MDRCCKEIVGLDLLDCCLGTEFNLLTATAYYEGVLGVAGASRVTAPRALALSHTPKKPHAPADPPPTDPADEQARRSPRQRRPHPRLGAKEESAGAAVANKSCCA